MDIRAFINIAALVAAVFAFSPTAMGQGADAACLNCHTQLHAITAGKQARPLGCLECHAALEAGSVPHRYSGRFALGLPADGAESCLSCHNKPAFTKLRHGSLGVGCTGCHDVHAPKHGTLVKEDIAAICYKCHDRKGFAAEVTHKPVARGDCDDCHEMHATTHSALVSGEPGEDCLGCHGRVKKGQHAAGSALVNDHPVGGEKSGMTDPARREQPFQCISCHDPHKFNVRGLIRFGQQPGGLCQNCHDF